MIVDTYDHISNYKYYNKNLSEAFEWIKLVDHNNLKIGKIEISGDKIFALVQRYNTGMQMDRLVETHRKYIDIQFVIHGIERFIVQPVHPLTAEGPYDPIDDVIFYKPKKIQSEIVLQDKMFAVFFPQDAHMGGLQIDSATEVIKVVVKVAV